jgi:hypothetical protein
LQKVQGATCWHAHVPDAVAHVMPEAERLA